MNDQTTTDPRQAARLQPDSRPVVLTATWLVTLLVVAAFVMGARGLASVGGWAGLTGWQAWLVPVVLDVGLGIAALAAVVARARQEPARLARVLLVGLTSLSVVAQVAHVVLPAHRFDAQTVLGAVIAAAAPLTVLAATEVLLSLAIAPPVRQRATRPARTIRPAASPAGVAAPARVRAPGSPKAAAKAAGAPRPGDDEILRLKAEGLSNQAVAEHLGVGKGSVQRAVERQRAAQAAPQPVLVDAVA